MICIGGLLANWIGYACGFAPYGEFQWRFPLALQIPPGVILFIGLQFFLPDSPRWLIRVGRYDEALEAFKSIRGLQTVSGVFALREWGDGCMGVVRSVVKTEADLEYRKKRSSSSSR